MHRYFLYLSYKGTYFHGWQFQPNAISVEEILNKSLFVVLREPVTLTGCGRTDAGVHASSYVAHFNSLQSDLHTNQTAFKLNNFLPKDISIKAIRKVRNNVSARFTALSRTYEYHISTNKNPFKNEYIHLIRRDLDIDRMNQAAEKLFDYIDFTSFCKGKTDNVTNNCTIMHAHWRQEGDELIFRITANRFLRNMVRSIVGLMCSVGSGQVSVSEFCRIIEAKDQTLTGISAPANGLFLTDIEYPKDIFVED